jgi:hypothetical protein
MGGISPEYYSISHYSMEKGMVHHNNSICIKDRPTNALSCMFLLLVTMAATCFGKTMPSSGSDWVPAELLQGSMC